MASDRVLTMHHYYDGPRLGIAELRGVPHVYEAEFDHSAEEFGDTYFLSPVEPGLLALVLEEWAIFCRWQESHRRGEVGVESHPALPNERRRYEELKAAIGDCLKTNPEKTAHASERSSALRSLVRCWLNGQQDDA